MIPRPGDLVVPTHDPHEETLLFSTPWDDEGMLTDQPVLLWRPEDPGLLLSLKDRYGHDTPIAEVLVGGTVGYTYADHMRSA